MNQIDVLKSEKARLTRSADWWGRFASKLSNDKRDLIERVSELSAQLSESKRDLETSRRAYGILDAYTQKDGRTFQQRIAELEKAVEIKDEMINTFQSRLRLALTSSAARGRTNKALTKELAETKAKLKTAIEALEYIKGWGFHASGTAASKALAAINSDAKKHNHATLDEALGCEDCQNEARRS